MERATVEQMMQAMEVAGAFEKAGLWFIPMPVLNPDDHKMLLDEVNARLEANGENCQIEKTFQKGQCTHGKNQNHYYRRVC